MSRARIAFSLVLPLVATLRVDAAEEPAGNPGSVEVKEQRPAVLAPATNSPSWISPEAQGSRPRVISPATAAQLAAAAPKYESIVPSKPTEPLPDLREIDKPRNTIIRLPPYLVPEGKPPPVLKERELLTPPARRELALKKFPGLRFGSFWIFSNDGIAEAMLREEERLEQKREFEDLASLMRYTDPAKHDAVKKEVDRAFLRPADFGR
jgi:hypothetical protein